MNVYERLCRAIADKNWNNFIEVLKPKDFPRDKTGTLVDKRILAKIAEILTAPQLDIPPDVRVVILKCLLNSCVEGYKHDHQNSDDLSSENYTHELYKSLSNTPDNMKDTGSFPYNGISAWAANYIEKHTNQDTIETDEEFRISKCSTDNLELLRLSAQFLCNLVTFGCTTSNFPHRLKKPSFKSAIIELVGFSEVPIARAACAFVHNALYKLPNDYFCNDEINKLACPLIKADERGIRSARETFIILLNRVNWLQSVYDGLSMENKLYLLEIIHVDIRDSVYSGEDTEVGTKFRTEVIQFLSERFKKRSDLILKTVDSYLDGMEPAEITILLDIIGVITSIATIECHLLQNDKSLFINCIFLLKSLHEAGKARENYFTPLQKLGDVAPNPQQAGSSNNGKDIKKHPAFGFKAGLIRAIGNLCHKHKSNQDLLRETDAIPLLLDCCNIDARNPLIMQWSIFALKNLCDNNPENQEIIRNCNKIGVVDNVVVREMGLKLHESEDGKAIGILPLPTNK